jgi:hypothetical protein
LIKRYLTKSDTNTFFYLFKNKKMRSYILLTGILCTALSCQRLENQSADIEKLENKIPISSSAAVEKNNDPERKFIRTADVKFKVKSVVNTTTDIENICTAQGGFVIYTNLTSNVDDHTETPISADSLLETTHYTVTNTITLRVPNTKLDSTLKDIAKSIDYLDYRIIKADDVSLQILANNFTQKRATNNYSRITNDIENNRKKLNETTDAEEMVLSKQEQADNAKIANLSLNDQIKYSTVNLSIYQRQGIKRAIIFNENNIDKYEIGFGYKLLEGFSFGWSLLKSFFVVLSKLWSVFLCGFLVYAGCKWYLRKK